MISCSNTDENFGIKNMSFVGPGSARFFSPVERKNIWHIKVCKWSWKNVLNGQHPYSFFICLMICNTKIQTQQHLKLSNLQSRFYSNLIQTRYTYGWVSVMHRSYIYIALNHWYMQNGWVEYNYNYYFKKNLQLWRVSLASRLHPKCRYLPVWDAKLVLYKAVGGISIV